MRGYTKAGVPEAIRAAGGAVYGISSEPQTLASEAHESWQVDFDLQGDPHHEIADTCRERGWLDLFVNPRTGFLTQNRAWAAHPKGYFQPGVIAISREGRVLYRWRSRPTRRNAGGATSRPLPGDVWQKTQAALERGGDADVAHDEPTRLDSPAPPWPLFVTLLLANGNFIRPEGFGLKRGGPDDVPARFARAVGKLVLFLSAWVAAFALLPTGWGLAALALWVACVTPGVIRLHREFQSLPDGEPDPAG